MVIGLAAGIAAGGIRNLKQERAGMLVFPEPEAVLAETQESRSEDKAISNTGFDSEETARQGASSEPVLMVLAMIITAGLLLLGPEYVYLRDFFGTRMNTIFKFYFQVWTLWALAGTFGIWYVYHRAAVLAGKIAAGLALLAILPGLVYLPGSLLVKFGGQFGPPTLNGMAYFAISSQDDYAAIQWLEENVRDRTVILEGTRGSYWIEGRSSRISMATGLPTLMGWVGHEHQWRGEYFNQVALRTDHIRQIYQSRSWPETQALLDMYGIEYVIVGALERSWYDPLYQAKFDVYMTEVFRSGGTTIYRYER
jgi:uncharacterized membrane protein